MTPGTRWKPAVGAILEASGKGVRCTQECSSVALGALALLERGSFLDINFGLRLIGYADE